MTKVYLDLRSVSTLFRGTSLYSSRSVRTFRDPSTLWLAGSDLELSGWGGVISYSTGDGLLASNRWIIEETVMSVFDEKYRVVRVEGDRLLLRGVHSGEVVTVLNSEPEMPLTSEEYPVGRLVALSDPSGAPLN